MLVAAISLAAACGGSKATEVNVNAQPATVDVTTAQAVVRPIPVYFEATGNLTSDAQTDVAPAVGGKIVEVNFDVGSYVNQGDVLVRLDSRDASIRRDQALAQVQQQRSAVSQAQAGVDQALANLQQTQAKLGVRDGQIFIINEFPAVKALAAQLELAEKEYQRASRLLATGDIARTIYDQRKAQRDTLVGQLEDARSNAAVAQRAVDAARAGVNSAKAAANAARSAVATLETQVAAADKAISDTVIRSPISGFVSERVADVGEFVSPNAPGAKVATIVRTSTLRLKIDVPEASIGKIATGQGISLQTSAYPDRNFAGVVTRVSPSIDPTARTLAVEADVQNTEGLLKPGQFATVRITQSKAESAVMVPVSSVKTVGETNSVFVIKDGIAREQFVQVGLLENDWIQIKQGVVEGDVVATGDLAGLTDGVFVRQ